MEAFNSKDLIQVCPMPRPWGDAYNLLREFSQSNKCNPQEPPKPLILSGWGFSSDVDKHQRWEETVRWAERNGCIELIDAIPESDLLYVEELNDYAYGDQFANWNMDSKVRPSTEDLDRYLGLLKTNWSKIVGPDLAEITSPLSFSGLKARKLLVQAASNKQPPWGSWAQRSSDPERRYTFTVFRAAVNEAISPHEVDHIDFVAK